MATDLMKASMRRLAKSAVYGAADLATARRGIGRSYDGNLVRFAPRMARYYPADHEPDKIRFLREVCRVGSRVVDGGAHIGLYTVLLANFVGPSGEVLAFEPTATTRKVLQRTLVLNKVKNARVIAAALAEQNGTRNFYQTRDPVSNRNSLAPLPLSASTVATPTSRLDDLDLENVSCIKLDIEGGELGALRGSVETLRRERPAIAMEVHPEQLALSQGSLSDIWELLREYDARVFRGGSTLLREEFLAMREPLEVQILLGA